jgi:hypothetical protein
MTGKKKHKQKVSKAKAYMRRAVHYLLRDERFGVNMKTSRYNYYIHF